jgi:SAM-dependent methyltransferase
MRQNVTMTYIPQSRASVWTRYWSRGAMHSCATSYGQSYCGSIAEFWLAGFERLVFGSRVLDIGTGNGPLPRLLVGLESRPDICCDAIDLAEIAPPWLVQLPASTRSRLRFHGACAAERMPFADASFDHVVSQWGLEYSQLALSVPELLRVLAPGGSIQLLLHHKDARPVALASEEAQHTVWLLQENSFLDIARAMLVPMALAGTPNGSAQLMGDIGANQLREIFNAQQDALQARIQQGRCTDVLSEIRQAVGTLFAMAARQGVEPASAAFEHLRTELQDALFRQQDLCNHALDEPAAMAIGDRLALGAPYKLDVLRDQDVVMAWALTVTPCRS